MKCPFEGLGETGQASRKITNTRSFGVTETPYGKLGGKILNSNSFFDAPKPKLETITEFSVNHKKIDKILKYCCLHIQLQNIQREYYLHKRFFVDVFRKSTLYGGIQFSAVCVYLNDLPIIS